MDTLTKLALGLIGQNRPRPLQGPASRTLELPPARRTGGLPLMEALAARRSERAFSSRALDDQLLADLLCGVTPAIDARPYALEPGRL